MTIPPPASPWANPLPHGQVGILKVDAASYSPASSAPSLGVVYAGRNSVFNAGDETNLTYGTSFTADLLGAQIPFTLSLSIYDWVLGTSRTESHDLGPSNTSQAITLGADEQVLAVSILRRF